MADQQTYILFGGAGGIGSELVQLLTEQGHRVVITSRNEERLDKFSDNDNVIPKVADISKFEDADSVVEEISKSDIPLAGVVNLAGSIFLKPAHMTSEQDWTNVIQTNLTSAFATVRATGKHMRKGGSVVLMSSGASRIGLNSHEAIAAAKGGVSSLALAASATYSSRNLRFNVVAPGLVETPLTESITGKEQARKASEAMHPLKRIGTPLEVAKMIAFLLDTENSWITGQVFGIDGGLSSVKS